MSEREKGTRFPAFTRRRALQLLGGSVAAGVGWVYAGRRSFASADAQFRLEIEEARITVDGVSSRAVSMGGSVPAPTLKWREGQEVVVHAVNRLAEPTSIHWHGLLIQGREDGAPGFNAFRAIPPGETYTYRFKLRQAGTYWYHSHSSLQEQAGMYGAIVIAPEGRDVVRTDRDYVLVLSDHTQENPRRVFANLKSDAGYYNRSKRTLVDFFRDARRDGFAAAFKDRLEWGEMRMDPTDLADVTGYAFLVNGRGPRDNWTGLFAAGERVRLRFINASAMSFFDVRIPGLPMTVVTADGQNVQPVRVDEFRFGVGETYDVVVLPRADKAFTILAEPVDRTGYARATLAPRDGMTGEMPELRARTILSMADMGMDHAAMGHGTGQASASVDHAAMGHAMPAAPAPAAPGVDHAAMGHAMPAAPAHSAGRPFGWADANTQAGAKALSYADLKSLTRNKDLREPAHEIELRLTGVMDRYIWTLNGMKFDHGEPIRVAYGDRVRIKFVNTTMMAHPMHLHGMFVELENGETERRPLKHVVVVPPGQTVSAILTADEPGDWPFHCHLLYHMAAGMMTRFIVEPRPART
jgi:CopA family copper-resistance protein